MAAGMLLPATSAMAIRKVSLPGSVRRTSEDVVIISGDGVGRAGGECDLESGNRWRICGKQPGLDLFCDLQVALHDNAIADFRNQQGEHQQAAIEVEIEGNDLHRFRPGMEGPLAAR